MTTDRQVAALLFDLALVLLVSQAFGALARRLGQPAVIGETFASILLGPTLLTEPVSTTLFPNDVRPLLAPLADLGIALFMFLVGLELDRKFIAFTGRVVVTVSLASMLVPFGFGTGLAWYLLTRYPTANRLGFVLFIGVAMAATAFPVLARILLDKGMQETPVGGLALASAAIGDVMVWPVLTVVVLLLGRDSGGGWRILLTIPYATAMLFVVRPLLRRLVAGRSEIGTGALAMVVVGVLVSGGITEWVGLHFVFGAFLLGLILPKDGDGALRANIQQRVEHISALLLPVYFVTAGLAVDLSAIGVSGLADLGLIMLVAVGSKFLGVYGAARVQHVPARESATLATLMNTRGLTGLVILTVGQQLGLLDQTLYSLTVAMAVLTTGMTGPLLMLIDRRGRPAPELARTTR
ncbi:MAG TPA: cation:proton antiporter [Mycobacteriales bacterium]|nr:cation:proton antiporter [Mycobacteriales bacterium]